MAESNVSDVMQHFTRIAEFVDVSPFREELDAAPDMWSVDTSRQRKTRCQRNTQNIFLRVPRKPLPPGRNERQRCPREPDCTCGQQVPPCAGVLRAHR